MDDETKISLEAYFGDMPDPRSRGGVTISSSTLSSWRFARCSGGRKRGTRWSYLARSVKTGFSNFLNCRTAFPPTTPSGACSAVGRAAARVRGRGVLHLVSA